MSTKTTFKRIALVAVAALGFGMLSVVPSNAASAASITIGTVPNARPGQTVAVPITVFLPAGLTTSDTITVNIEATAAPLQGGSANAASIFNAGTGGTDNQNGQRLSLSATPTGVTPAGVPDISAATELAGRIKGTAPRETSNSSPTGMVSASSGAYALTAGDIARGSFTWQALVTPDVIGSYSFLVSTSTHTVAANATSAYMAGDINTSFSLTAGSNTVTAVSLTPIAGTDILAGSPNGVPVMVTLTGGTLSGIEGINLTATGGGRIAPANGVVPGSFAAAGATTALTAANFAGGSSAIIFLRSAGTTAETINLVATSAAMGTPLTASRTFAVTDDLGDATNNITIQAPTAGAATAPTFAANNVTGGVAGTSTYTVSTTSTSQRIGYTTAALATAAAVTASGTQGYITIVDTRGLLTGVAGLQYDRVTSFAFADVASGGAFTFAANMSNVPAGADAFVVTIPVGTASTVGVATSANTITFRAAAPTNSGTVRVTPATTILAAPGAALTFTASVRDQFGSTLLNAPLTVTTTGRNNPAATSVNTGSTGSVTFTTADASTSTTNLVDTVTFTSGSATAAVVTITYRDAAVGTVTVTGGNTTDSVNALTNTTNPISVGTSTAGVEAGAITITATVKDALGNALAGVPVSFTVAGTGVAFTSTSATRYTGSTGTATGSLYAWVAGTYTYTVTAGGKTTTGTATFGSTTATNARVVSATVADNVVTGRVVDRLGNPVSGVTLYAVATSPANIGGAFLATGTTGANGTASWVVSGNGSVTVTAVNPALPAGSTFGQTCALAGNRTCATATTAAAAYAASTVGTATTAETHVGASFAPAGVASATVEVSSVDTAQVAADAAAEATDAANAATDAANAAAEAADAATAAAQDAADAVAALSTQVTELVSALRKQITSLTNLVIKIQRKVRA
jgi:trimeric autotransporter adhesin